jgi:hypothetical protein
MAMAIDRTNSFHLMLSTDELTLLRLLAEREGLTSSDYLRTLLRREAGGAASRLSHVRDTVQFITGRSVESVWADMVAAAPRAKPATVTAAKRRSGRTKT